MKLEKWLYVVVACMITLPAFAKRKVSLHGTWVITEKSLVPDIPIIGSLEETTGELLLEFVGDLGEVVVTVTDASGHRLYQETVSTATTSVWSYTLDPSAMGGFVTVTDGENVVYGMLNF